MAGRTYRAQVRSISWIPGGTCLIGISPQVSFRFEPGQFLSLKVSGRQEDQAHAYWRTYSFANSHEHALEVGYEFCIKPTPGGLSELYLKRLRVGDWVDVKAPYGDFGIKTPEQRGVCMIATGTGIAPFRSFVQSKEFQRKSYPFAHAILGFRRLEEVPYLGEFENRGIKTVYALSHETGWSLDQIGLEVFSGRVTDYLKSLPSDYPWMDIDFYMCGNTLMIQEVQKFLLAKEVQPKAIHFETFSVPSSGKKVA